MHKIGSFWSPAVMNLFALRSPNPDALRETADPVGPKNDDHLQAVCEEAEMVVIARGANGSLQGRASEVAGLLAGDFHALDTTKADHPVHPLYQPADADLIPWSADDLES
ncbi:DUF1643 domain-containing protein [Natronosalvus rutilus]|nr:DUF1643 domain-containing protein [Natronosalvus rutilus]